MCTQDYGIYPFFLTYDDQMNERKETRETKVK